MFWENMLQLLHFLEEKRVLFEATTYDRVI